MKRIARQFIFIVIAVGVVYVVFVIRGDTNAVFHRWLSKQLIFSRLIKQRNKTRDAARMKALVFTSPTFVDYLKFIAGKGALDKDQVQSYIQYYEQFVKYFPEESEGYSLLGYYYSLGGDSLKAVEYLERSLQIDPDIFWSTYNLCGIYYKRGDLFKAIFYAQKCLTLARHLNLGVAYESKAYKPIFMTANITVAWLEKSAREALANCQMIVNSQTVSGGEFALKVF